MLASKENSYHLEETELRLGLPGGRDVSHNSNGKRGFSDTQAVDLKLHLSSSSTTATMAKDVEVHQDDKEKAKPLTKAQIVGWPPVRSSRKNIVAAQKATTSSDTDKATASTTTATNSAALVKVSMDGAPYLRKVDLKMYKSYQELSHALGTMFSSFTVQRKDLITNAKLIDPLNGSEFVPTYEDKDGDWMLIGDVPWEMFVESCKRLRIMKGSEAVGLGELRNARAKAEA